MHKLTLILLALACCAGNASGEILFRCPAQFDSLQHEIADYLQTLNIPAALVVQTADTQSPCNSHFPKSEIPAMSSGTKGD